MNHSDNLRDSMMVRIPVRTNKRIENVHGQYWKSVAYYVLGLHDLRPRLGTFTNPWGAKSCPIFATPAIATINDSLSDLLDKRAVEILAISEAEQRPIAIMWSGGTDSTAVLSAFIKNAKNLDQLVVYLSTKSILENPIFYQKFISGKIRCEHTRYLDVTEDFISKNILQHGDPGDCLFGPSMPMYSYLLPDKRHLLPWRDNLKLIADGIEHTGAHDTPGLSNWYTNKVSANIEEVGIYNVDTIADWWWWHYFNLKWEFSILRPFFETRLDTKTPISQAAVQSYASTLFYNTPEFQNWSYTNLPRLCADPKQHKIDQKRYIYELDKNDFYFSNKVKTESLAGVLGNRPAYMTADLVSYKMSEPGVEEAILEKLEQYRG